MRAIFFLFLAALMVLSPASVSALSAEQRRVLNSGSFHFNVEDFSVCNNIGIVNGSVDRFLQVLAFQESGGNPLAESGSSSASGKYQYIDSTWRSRVSIYGPAGDYQRASQAPEEVQDAVAYIEYTQKFRDMDNDLFNLAVSHFLPAAISNPSLLDVVPSGNSITPRQYAERLIENIGQGVGSDIGLYYGEAPEFDTWLERAGGAAPTVNGGSISSSGGCASSALGGSLVEIAQRELEAGANESDGSYLKYTGGQHDAWCAYFVSWVFEQSGSPLEGGPYPAVVGMMAFAQENGYYHPKGEAGFVPQPGDVVIYNEDVSPYPSHVNFVISYDAISNSITTIGGNESNTIKQATWDADMSAITGFMRVQ